MRENGLFKVHETLNEIEDAVKDKTYEIGSKQIDTVLETEDILRVIQESILVDFKDIVDTDHRGFIFDLDIKEYFLVDASEYDKNDNITLDPTKWSHQCKFLEKVDKYIDQLKLVETVTEKCNRSVTG